MKKIFLFTALVPFILNAADPVFYAPLDDACTVIGINGKKVSDGTIFGAAKYVPGISGKALDVKRHAYDQVTNLTFTKLPAMDLNQGTIAFWFKPHWKENDGEFHPILSGRDRHWKGFRFYMNKQKGGGTELSVCIPGQNQILTRNLFKQEKWQHVAFSWNTANGQVNLYINGTLKVKNVRANVYKKQKPVELNLYTGGENTDRFKAIVGNGCYDEIKVFNAELTPADIFVLASGGSNIKLNDLSLAPAIRRGNSLTFGFRNNESKLPGPKKLLVLNGRNGKTISFTAMGASGKLSMIVTENKKNYTVSSSYILNLTVPHRMTVSQDGNQLTWKIDDGVQETLTLSAPFGAITNAQGADGVQLLSPTDIPTAVEQKRLNDSSMTRMEQNIWELKDAWKSVDGVRKTVCLNGYWRVAQCNEFNVVPPKGAFRYSRVPGSFRSPLFKIYKEEKGELKDAGWQYNGKGIFGFRSAWYQRVFAIPADLKGQRIYLRFDNLNGNSGRIYVNGKLVDEFRQDFKCWSVIPNRRRVDVTGLIDKNGRNTVTVFIDRAITALWRGQQSIGDFQEMAIGDVFLEGAPDKIFVKTAIALSSYRNKELILRCRIANPAGLKGSAKVRYDFSMNGKVEKTAEQNITLTGDQEQLVLFKEGWSDPVLWDSEHPNCYKMSVSLVRNGKVSDTFPAQDFGFRECWIEGSDFRMNGKPLRLRMWSSPALERVRQYYGAPEAIDQYVSHIKFMNYNAVRMDPVGGGNQVGHPEYHRSCDRLGLYNLSWMPPYEDEDKTQYNKQVVRFFEEYGNHPNILMYYTEFNTCGYSWSQDPGKLTDLTYNPAGVQHPRKRAYYAESVIRGLDSTREVFQHAGANAGKIFTSMNYQSFGTPIQEQMDWPEQWFKAQKKNPLMVVECGFPYPMQFSHFDKNEVGFLTAEHAARYYGDSVFADERFPANTMGHWNSHSFQNWNPNYLRLSAMMYRLIVPSWRAYNMSALGDFPGERDMARTARTFNEHTTVYAVFNNVKTPGLKPDQLTGGQETHKHLLTDYSRPNAIYKTIRGVFEPLYVQIGGDPAHFTEQGHAYWSKEEFKKTIVVVNDLLEKQTLECLWELRTADGTKVTSGKETITVDAGGIVKYPLTLEAPYVFKRTEGVLNLAVLKDGVLLKEDQLALQFFPKRAQPNFSDANAVVYDPVGKTTAMLKKAGYPFREAKTIEDVRNARILIIGQEALGISSPALLKQIEAGKLIEHGLNILIFEQKQCGVANLVFTAPSYRNAFIRKADSRYIAGLKNEDFSNWRGESDTVPAFVISNERSPHYPRSKWKCGNTGIVSGNVIRKPGYGNFTTIVDSGFNLMFASLLELRKGHGVVLFCQLDVTSRFMKDPAATKLVDNMLSVMSERFRPVGPVRIYYFGNEDGTKRLDRMGVQYKRLSMNSLWMASDAQVVIVGKTDKLTPKDAERIKGKLQSKSCIYLPDANPELLPYGIKKEMQTVWRATLKTDDIILRDIPAADLYFRERRKMPVYTNLPDWAMASKPAILVKIDGNENTKILLPPVSTPGVWNYEKMSRVWNVIFNEMNIGMGKDMKLFSGSKTCANKITSVYGDLEPKNAELALDMKGTGTISNISGFSFKPIRIGNTWEAQGFTQDNPYYVYPKNTPKGFKQSYEGYAWYRIKVFIPADWKKYNLSIECEAIDDCDWTWWNGVSVGTTNFDNNPAPWKAKRVYRIPAKAVKYGAENVIMVRVFDRWSGGGIVKPFHIIAKSAKAEDAWSPYIDKLDFYDVDAFHNW